jgi:hypothetical protein
LQRNIRNYFGILVLLDFKYRHIVVSNAVIGVFLECKEKNKKYRFGSNELYQRTVDLLRKTGIKQSSLSKTVFLQKHIEKMIKDNILHKSSEYPSKLKRVYYSLTEDAKKMRDLNILGLSEDRIQFKKIYKKFFLYEILYSRRIGISFGRQLNKVISQLKMSRNNLIWEKGVSIEQISRYDNFSDSKFEYDIVKKALTLLKENGLTKIALTFGNEIRYLIADEKLYKLIDIIGDIFKEELSLLIYKWRHFSKETPDEEDRLKWVFGERISKNILQAARISRYENKKAREKCNDVIEYNEYLKQKCVSESELSLIERELEIYDNKSKIKNSTKSPKEDIRQYFSIREQNLKEIESNFVKKIKYIQKNYKHTIQEYAFLFRHILNNFCPQILKRLGLPRIMYKPVRLREQRHRLELLESILSEPTLES